MKVLLDTHVLLWYLDGDALPSKIIDILEDKETKRVVSIASLWELAIKISINKLQTSRTLPDIHRHLLSQINFEILDIKFTHLQALLTLPHYHNDPFDRLIITQSLVENVPIISADRHFSSYHTTTIW